MVPTVRALIATLICLSLATVMGACGRKSPEPAPSGSSPSATSEIHVTEVKLGRAVGGDKRITDTADRFGPNDVIYASVATSGSAPSATLQARWTYQDGQVVDESEQTIAPTGDEATEFHISKPDGWPAGRYTIEVFLNGALVEKKDFTVEGS